MTYKRIKVLKEKDLRLLKGMANTGLVSEDTLKNYNISRRRINQHIKSRYVEKKRTIILSNLTNTYVLSDLGKRIIKRKYFLDCYKGNSVNPTHDYVLSEFYSLLKPDEQDSWLNENTLYKNFNKKVKKTTDGLFKSRRGLKIGIEIITNNYSDKDIEKKREFIEKYCDDHIILNADSYKSFKLDKEV